MKKEKEQFVIKKVLLTAIEKIQELFPRYGISIMMVDSKNGEDVIHISNIKSPDLSRLYRGIASQYENDVFESKEEFFNKYKN